MKLPATALIGLALAGCSDAPPADCQTAIREWPQCFDRYRDRPRAFFLNCIPYAAPERMAGSWARDFEFEEFYENQTIPLAQAIRFRPRSVRLLLDAPLHRDANGTLQASVSWIEFEGRRPVCDIIPEERMIVVDRVVSERIVEIRPSEWQD